LASEGALAWLVDASYDAGQVSLHFVRASDLETIRWTDKFHPYYLIEGEHGGENVRKVNLFTQETVSLQKVNYVKKPPKDIHGWEAEIDPALSYVYDNGVRFGLLHMLKDGHWLLEASLEAEQSSRFDRLFDDLREKNPLKYGLVREAYTHTTQPVPRISGTTLGITDSGGTEEDYYNAFLLSRLANLPIPRTYRNHAVSDWIRSMLCTYYRAHNILIPTSEELKLGDKRKFVTGALTIAPESGEYFNMVVLDYESLYPGCIDVFNLSYETVRCSHPECQKNSVPGLDYCICARRRGIYSALIGALRDLRLRVFKPLLKSELPESGKTLSAGSRTLKLFLVSCFGVTVRIHGLASPLLAEAITAYGRHVLQSTWDMAKERELKPRYGDTDSVFLDNPPRDGVERFVESVRNRFGLQLAYDRAYAVCVLSSAKKAYFGILPNGEPEIKGLAIAKSNSPRFFQETFQKCLAKLSEGRQSADDFQRAKQHVPDVVKDAIRALREGRVPLSDLEYRVELRDDPREKSKAKTLPQAYQAATLLLKEGKEVPQGAVVGFVKVHRFRFQGRQFTVKPTTQANTREISVRDYIRNLSSSLAQTFEPMGIKIELPEADLSEFL
jgi:DNA polymerase elongation subunit (family B)